jgi:WhiB family redox-sensing transcriptional regulator
MALITPGLRPLASEWDWQMQGHCRAFDGAANSPFYHPDGERGKKRTLREDRAKAVCASCPVLERCRRHALDTKQQYGTWGGMSETERRKLLAAAKKNPAILASVA